MPVSAEEPCQSDEALRTVIDSELWSVPHLCDEVMWSLGVG